jgi:hypothetical protein
MAIPEIQAISLQTLISKTLPGIPFVNKVDNIMNFYVNVTSRGSKETQERLCTDYFIEHYFPEYYPLVVDRDNAEFASFGGFYDELRNTISDSLFLEKVGPFNVKDTFKLSLQEGNIYDLKEAYEEEEKLPDFLDALAFFNAERGAGAETGATSFEFTNVPNSLDKLTGTISDFSTAISLFKGIVPLSLDANSLGTFTNRIVNALLRVIYESLDFKLQESNFFDSDYLTMYFDSDSNIVRVDYFVLNVTRGETKQAKIGFITNSKYNPIFSDPLALKTVENYKEIIESSEQQSNLTKQQSITGFFSTLGIEGSFTAPQIGDIPGSITPGNNIFGNRSSDDLIDVSNMQQLEDTFSKLKTKEELLKEIEEAENEETKKNILQAEKAKKLNAAVQIVDTIDAVLNFNVPIFGPNATKEQKIVNQILNQFGIQALAKEAIICLTLGLGATASRITQSVRNSIIQQASSLQSEPTPPSKEINIKRPNLGELFSDQFKPFSVNGDIKDQIKDIILGAIANAAFEVIKSLVELIQFNCGSILRGNTGAIDVGSRIRDENQRAAVSFPNLEELLEAEFAQDGLALDQVYTYFSDVSSVLNPIEVCRLLNSQREVEPFTYAKILDFNSDYSSPQIRNNINTIGSINSYFSRISQYVDTVTFCNDIINNNILQVVENCNICLDEDFFDSTPALDELIRIAEDGIQIAPPPLDFLCPDSPNYLENPIATTILPNLFNNILDTTKTYMAGSLEAARTSLLEPTVSNDINPDVAGAFGALGIQPPTASLDPAVLNFITDMFEFFDNINEEVVAAAQSGVCQEIDSAKIQNIIDNAGIVATAIRAGLSEVPGVIEEVDNKITSIQDQATGTGPAHTKYVFPEAFRKRFAEAVQPLNYVSPVGGLLRGRRVDEAIYQTNYNSSGQEQLTLNFVFSRNQQFSVQYPEWSQNVESFINLSYNLQNVDPSLAGELSNLVPPENSQLPISEAYQDLQLNPYIYRFVEPISIAENESLGDSSFIQEVVGEKYTSVYGSLYRKLYNYILDNGAFSAFKVNNLKFFKNNDLCDPSNVGDLFDAEGILDQMKKEFAAAACYDDGSAKDKTRNTLYYGLILMLIQSIIDEFVIKNIVVFSAFKMDSLLDLPVMREYMVNRLVASFNEIKSDGNSILERELFNYFDRVSRRESTINNGGIAHTYPPFQIPQGFELNDDGTAANFPLNDESALIRFLVEERLYYTWDNGQRSTLGAINNIIDPKGENKSFDDVFLEDVITVNTINAQQEASVDFDNAAYITNIVNDSFDINGVYFTDGVTISNDVQNSTGLSIQRDANILSLNLYSSHNSDSTLFSVTPLFSIPIDSNNTRQENLALIKQDPQYQLFKNQVFNQDAIILGPILHNFYLTELFFSDITDAFRGTKRAIINFMNMTDASTRPPLPDTPNNNFQNTLANNGQQDMGSLAREIFLKFLRETPIQILKGLVELIDPHVAISKIVKDVTGQAFIAVSQAIQTGLDAAAPSDSEAPNPLAGITGEDILALMFCIYDTTNEVTSGTLGTGATGEDSPLASNAEAEPLFGPRITLDGVDFKGTVAGMFMAPPSPLGILYLLIELLKIKIDEELSEEDVGDATEPPPPEEC